MVGTSSCKLLTLSTDSPCLFTLADHNHQFSRRRKVKCNGARPSCRHCLAVSSECKWPTNDPPSTWTTSSTATPSTGHLPANQAKRLFDIFFNTAHLAFIRQSIHQPSFEATPLPSVPPFLSFAICSLAALHISHLDVVDVFNGETATELSQRLATSARKYSRDTSDQPTVSCAQANVILAFRELCSRNITPAWMYAGLAIRMAQEMRLGKEYFQRHSSRDREIRRRTLWTCFIMDRMLCFLTARPQVFRTRQISIQLPCPARSFLFDQGFQGPGIADFQASAADTTEVLPFLIKAVDLWGVMIDLFGTVGNASPGGLIEYEEEFYKAHNAVLEWVINLPPRITWSMDNYRIFCMLGEDNLFVSMHMLLNHALCTLHQAHLPQVAHNWLPPGSPDAAWSQEIATICCRHANLISDIACSLFQGDSRDKEALRSPFSGAAIVSAACVQLWNLHSGSRTPDALDDASQRLASLKDILRSWEKSWAIASSWTETIALVQVLYGVAYGKDGVAETYQFTAEQPNTSNLPSASSELAGAAGLPEPRNVSPRLFEKIRHILFTISEPSALQQVQSRLHIRSLWSHMCLQAQMSVINPATFEDVEDFSSSLDDCPELPFGWDDIMATMNTL